MNYTVEDWCRVVIPAQLGNNCCVTQQQREISRAIMGASNGGTPTSKLIYDLEEAIREVCRTTKT